MALSMRVGVAVPSSFSLRKTPNQSIRCRSNAVVVCSQPVESASSCQVSEEKWISSRRDIMGGAASLLTGIFATPAFALLEADDDDSLLEKVKVDRQKRLEKRGTIVSYKKEAELVQKAVYELSKAGQALDSQDFSTASSVLGTSLDDGWIGEVKTALMTVSKSAEEQGEVATFTSALGSLQSAVSKHDTELSKSAFVASAGALEKWSILTGLVEQIKGL